ncbi:hypothetical protein SSPO_003990 [Streptomyces antimycoticus]|uniref:Uncharacterized protein n=1 Tax=Streptomyces antimycoticus TaxID=68175 RepID=A0A499UKI1_9ACTN|nr:hypothetical protein SSPO_003990 [Streptomyces antimycoticus]
MPSVSNADLWRRDGLHRLTSRRVSVERAGDALRTVDKVSAADSALFVMVESVWTLDGGELELRVEIEPSSGWRTVWPRVGIRLSLPDGTAPVDAPSGSASARWSPTPTASVPCTRAASRPPSATSRSTTPAPRRRDTAPSCASCP